MSTIPDIELNAASYTEIYAATGITAGASIMVQNKARGHVYIQYNDSKPADQNSDGFIIVELGVWTVPAGNQKIWMKGPGFVAVDIVSVI